MLKKEAIEITGGLSAPSKMPGYAAAVYDTIIGAEMTHNYDIVRAGLDWFKQHFAAQYMVVLD